MKKVLKAIAKSWKTTVTGIVTIVTTLLVSKGKISTENASAIVAGVGLIIAKDGDKSHTEN